MRSLQRLDKHRLWWTRNRLETGWSMHLALKELRRRFHSDVVEMPSLSQRIQENPKELPFLVSHVLRQMIGEPPPGLFESVCR